VNHEPPVPLASHVSQYAIHKGPTVALARLGCRCDQSEYDSTWVRLVLFKKCKPFKDAIVLEYVVSNALPQVDVEVVAVIL
jgi:hypothetical protein